MRRSNASGKQTRRLAWPCSAAAVPALPFEGSRAKKPRARASPIEWRRGFFSTPPRLSSRCGNRVVLVRKSIHCGRTGRRKALVTKSFRAPEPSRSNSIPQCREWLKCVHAPWDQERSAGAFHRSGRRKAQGRQSARTYILAPSPRTAASASRAARGEFVGFEHTSTAPAGYGPVGFGRPSSPAKPYSGRERRDGSWQS